MLEGFLTVGNQILILFLLIAAGYLVTRTGLITEFGAKQMTNVLLFLITPAVVVSAFETPFDSSRLAGLGISAASAAATHLLGIYLSKLCFRKHPEDRQCVYRCAVIYSNCGFMALPLIDALIGREGLFYGAAYILVFNIFVWTHGIMIMSGDRGSVKARQIFINPGVIASGLALVMFFLSVTLPPPIQGAVRMLANVNTPLAMIVIGAFLARVSVRSIFSKTEVYIAAALRLLAVPLIILLALSRLGLPEALFKTCVISACAPPAATVSLFSARFSRDAGLAGELIAFATAFSIVTMPLLLMLTDMLS